jgi:hypothetical protein
MQVLDLIEQNETLARQRWGGIDRELLSQLHELTRQYDFSITRGELQLLGRNWYVTHAGLLRLAQRQHCNGIHTELLTELSDPRAERWVFKATVFKTVRSKGFVGFGDADPSNVSPLVRRAELRVAETRAVNRALRKAYGIGLCPVEELGAGPSGARAERPRA